MAVKVLKFNVGNECKGCPTEVKVLLLHLAGERGDEIADAISVIAIQTATIYDATIKKLPDHSEYAKNIK